MGIKIDTHLYLSFSLSTDHLLSHHRVGMAPGLYPGEGHSEQGRHHFQMQRLARREAWTISRINSFQDLSLLFIY